VKPEERLKIIAAKSRAIQKEKRQRIEKGKAFLKPHASGETIEAAIRRKYPKRRIAAIKEASATQQKQITARRK